MTPMVVAITIILRTAVGASAVQPKLIIRTSPDTTDKWRDSLTLTSRALSSSHDSSDLDGREALAYLKAVR